MPREFEKALTTGFVIGLLGNGLGDLAGQDIAAKSALVALAACNARLVLNDELNPHGDPSVSRKIDTGLALGAAGGVAVGTFLTAAGVNRVVDPGIWHNEL